MRFQCLMVGLAISTVTTLAFAGMCEYVDTKAAKVTSPVAGGAGASVLAGASAMELAGISAVAHSSTTWILTGSGGYIASALGAVGPAGSVFAATPVIVGAGLVAGVAVVGGGGVALYCHPAPVFGRVRTFFGMQREKVGEMFGR